MSFATRILAFQMDGHTMVTEYCKWHAEKNKKRNGQSATPRQRVYSMSSNKEKQDEIRGALDAPVAIYDGFISKPVTQAHQPSTVFAHT
jgi:hypothetical protein